MSILRLQYTRPDGEVDTYHLKSVRRYHIGRGSQCEVRILDMKLSRHHCAIEMSDGRWMLLDLGSTNGVRLNGKKIAQCAPLFPGCLIEVGASQLRIEGISGWESSDEHGAGPATKPQTVVQSTTDSALERLAAAKSGSDGSTAVEIPAAARRRPVPDTADLTPAPGVATLAETSAVEESRAGTPATDEPTLPVATLPVAAPAAPTPVPPAAQAASGPPRDAEGRVRPVTVRVGNPGTSTGTGSSTGALPIDRNIHITLLGQKVGPLTRAEARDLKARELKGTLTTADLAPFLARG